MRERVGEVVGVAQQVGRDVGEDRLLAEVEADHLRHERVDRLVVGHPGADGVGERDAAGAVGLEQARHAQHRVGPEGERVEEVVVDAAVDHVHALRPLGGAHEDGAVLDEEVLPLDQLDAHLLGEEGVLEVGAVEVAGREQHDHRVLDVAGRDLAQRLEQQVRVVVDRADGCGAKSSGKSRIIILRFSSM